MKLDEAVSPEISIAVKRAIERRQFDRLEDGRLCWFPSRDGGIDAGSLRAIAEYMEDQERFDR
jgi:hypothetical protein